MAKNKEINHPHLILCEGADATLFIIYYLEYLLTNGEMEFDGFQAMNFGGNDELSGFLRLLPIYDIVKSITIIRDAETDHNAAKQSICTVLKNYGFAVPSNANEIVQNGSIKVAYSLFPTLSKNTENGTLEKLYLNNLAETPYPKKLINDIELMFLSVV